MNYQSPYGALVMGFSCKGIALLDWESSPKHPANLGRVSENLVQPSVEVVDALKKELDAYFAGSNDGFDLPLDPAGSDFEQRIWNELMRIPRGTTMTYGEVAARIGCSKGVRAVASAIGRNPISVIVPCHRVVGAGNKLGGYAGGMAAKTGLLRLEGVTLW